MFVLVGYFLLLLFSISFVCFSDARKSFRRLDSHNAFKALHLPINGANQGELKVIYKYRQFKPKCSNDWNRENLLQI